MLFNGELWFQNHYIYEVVILENSIEYMTKGSLCLWEAVNALNWKCTSRRKRKAEESGEEKEKEEAMVASQDAAPSLCPNHSSSYEAQLHFLSIPLVRIEKAPYTHRQPHLPGPSQLRGLRGFCLWRGNFQIFLFIFWSSDFQFMISILAVLLPLIIV